MWRWEVSVALGGECGVGVSTVLGWAGDMRAMGERAGGVRLGLDFRGRVLWAVGLLAV